VGRDFPLDHLVVRHEDLADDFEPAARAVWSFMGLSAAPSRPDAPGGAGAPEAGHWRWYDRPMAAIMPTLKPWVDSFGYPSA
jgi:hypothetical protein